MKLMLMCGAVFAAVFAGGLWVMQGPGFIPPAQAEVSPPAAYAARIVDGDTLVLDDGERVRIQNIDTAEMPPRSQCDREAQLARQAKARLSELVRGRPLVLTRQGRDRDQYDRLLRRVSVDGRDIGEQLVREGLAQRWEGHKAIWC